MVGLWGGVVVVGWCGGFGWGSWVGYGYLRLSIIVVLGRQIKLDMISFNRRVAANSNFGSGRVGACVLPQVPQRAR